MRRPFATIQIISAAELTCIHITIFVLRTKRVITIAIGTLNANVIITFVTSSAMRGPVTFLTFARILTAMRFQIGTVHIVSATPDAFVFRAIEAFGTVGIYPITTT